MAELRPPRIKGAASMLKEDLHFLQVVSIVASRMGCTIDSVDADGRTVSITCPLGKQQEIECAAAIQDIMGDRVEAENLRAL